MSISKEYLEYVMDQLDSMGPITSKNMFGGAGIYHDDIFFALIANDTLYFKVDDSNRPDYEAAAMVPFKPRVNKPYTMQYYQVPIDILENDEKLKVWAYKALDVAILKLNTTKEKN